MNLRDIFNEYRDKKFFFIKSRGNYGDNMIYAGAEKLASELGLKYYNAKYNSKINSNNVIYLHGGGGYNSWWGWTNTLLKLIRKRHPDNLIIIGPSSTSLELDYLKDTLPKDSNKIIFFAREMVTYAFIKDNFFSNTYHDHDTALFLTKEDDFFKKITSNISVENKYSLLAIRQDPERIHLPEIIRNRKYDVVCDPINCEMVLLRKLYSFFGITSKKWSRIHLKAKLITTNRTHSAILGVISGKEVEIFSNSYHKNRGIWEYSLKDRGVKWIE